MAPVIRELGRDSNEFEHVVVHTGQHYDDEMSQVFFEDLAIEHPRHWLNVGAGSHIRQVASVMERLEPIFSTFRPDLVLVPGDVNSTLGGALAATTSGIPVGHIEAGLRSFDWTMPEEKNRVVVDRVSDLLFIHSPNARTNLVAEGADDGSIYFVGNTMIDSLVALRRRIERTPLPDAQLKPQSYLLVTLHRPSLVDDQTMLEKSLHYLTQVSKELEVVFPVHPRTQAMVQALGYDQTNPRMRFLPALGYIAFMSLLVNARAVLTDSGGIQEETTYLGVPCFTLRRNTERPITSCEGTNTILGLRPERIQDIPALLDSADAKLGRVPEKWDGRAAERIVELLRRTETWDRIANQSERMTRVRGNATGDVQ